MAFKSGRQDEIQGVGAGEVMGNCVISDYTVFEDGMGTGLFAQYNTGTGGVESLIGTVGVPVAGVVKRDVTGAIEDGGKVTKENTMVVSAIESGLVTVTVVSGLTINKFDEVFAFNQADVDNDGKATNVSGGSDVAVDGYFFKEVSKDVWTIRIK